MSFYLRIYDNFHYMDESEAYNSGKFETNNEALDAAKDIVEKFLLSSLKPGITPKELLSQFDTFGEDPVIRSTEQVDFHGFSARDYAESRVEEICNSNNNK